MVKRTPGRPILAGILQNLQMFLEKLRCTLFANTAQKEDFYSKKFPFKDFYSKNEQVLLKLQICSH